MFEPVWSERRLASGVFAVKDAGDRVAGGVYGISRAVAEIGGEAEGAGSKNKSVWRVQGRVGEETRGDEGNRRNFE